MTDRWGEGYESARRHYVGQAAAGHLAATEWTRDRHEVAGPVLADQGGPR